MPYSGDWSWRGASGSGCVEKGLRSVRGGRFPVLVPTPKGCRAMPPCPEVFAAASTRCVRSLLSLMSVPSTPAAGQELLGIIYRKLTRICRAIVNNGSSYRFIL